MQSKKNLVDRLSISESEKLKQVLTELTLRERYPSQLLREMKTKNEGRLSDTVIKTLWLQRLAHSMQAVLACHSGTLEQLAACADTIHEIPVSNSMFSINSKHISFENLTNSNKNPSMKMITDLAKLMSDLTLEVRLLKEQVNAMNRSRSSSRSTVFNEDIIQNHLVRMVIKDYVFIIKNLVTKQINVHYRVN